MADAINIAYGLADRHCRTQLTVVAYRPNLELLTRMGVVYGLVNATWDAQVHVLKMMMARRRHLRRRRG